MLWFSDDLSQHYDELRAGISALADFDCLFSLSEVARQQGYVKPTLCKYACKSNSTFLTSLSSGGSQRGQLGRGRRSPSNGGSSFG
jgi:hypothetical protein